MAAAAPTQTPAAQIARIYQRATFKELGSQTFAPGGSDIDFTLKQQGYTVLEAADGNEALALAQANGVKIQLLVTDVIMPGLSSKMLAEWLKQVNPGVRVLFISGYINNNAVRDSMSKPGTFFLQKPFNPLDLTKKVREAIEAP